MNIVEKFMKSNAKRADLKTNHGIKIKVEDKIILFSDK